MRSNETGRSRREVPKVEQRIIETRAAFLERVRNAGGKAFDAIVSRAKDAARNPDRCKTEIADAMRAFGIDARDVSFAAVEVRGLQQRATLTLPRSSSTQRTAISRAKTVSPYGIALVGAMVAGNGAHAAEPSLLEKSETLSKLLHGPMPTVPELTDLAAPDCGPAKPEHAPDECGVQQWKGFSETNPIAVAWLAIANTGTEACTVQITQFDLTYLERNSENGITQRRQHPSDMNGAQLLADGTDGRHWGAYITDIQPSREFTLEPDSHTYIHPFGTMMEVSDEVTELTVTFAAEITEGCVVSSGIDTYEEFATPNTKPPYTQDGSDTDFIKEAMKSPWVSQTVPRETPVAISIQHRPRHERTGWSKEDEDVIR